MIDLPKKTREIHNEYTDSTIWNDWKFRDDDIVIATYPKSGTTWIQQIVGQLIFNGSENINVAEMSPWIDFPFPSPEEKLTAVESQTHRRFLKTHLPANALVFSPQAKYIYIGRDGRDIVWSLYNHCLNFNQVFYDILNNINGRVVPPIVKPNESIEYFFHNWLYQDEHPFFDHIKSWWKIQELPNILLLHYTELKKDLPGKIRRIAEFLNIPINPDKWEAILEHCSFDYMKLNAVKCVPFGGAFWHGGAQTFMHKGNNGRWRNTLTPQESQRYEQMAREELGEICAYWLATGEGVLGKD